MMKIAITHNEAVVYALVDDDDYPLLSRHTWHLTGPKLYPATFLELENGKRRILSMHRMILGGTSDIDHENGDVLNAQKYNLRKATRHQNEWNKPKQKTVRGKPCTSVYKGVSLQKNGTWKAMIMRHGIRYNLGCFNTQDEAAAAYNKKCAELSGDFSWMNPIDGKDDEHARNKHTFTATNPDQWSIEWLKDKFEKPTQKSPGCYHCGGDHLPLNNCTQNSEKQDV